MVGNFSLGDTLTFTSLSGVTIVKYEGSAVLEISGDTIAVDTAGTAWNLLLSDGTYLPLENSVYDVSGGNNHPVNSGVEFIGYTGGSFTDWSITHN